MDPTAHNHQNLSAMQKPSLADTQGQPDETKGLKQSALGRSGLPNVANGFGLAWVNQEVEGVLPQMVILETCSDEDADTRERLWIKRFQLSGFEGAILTNSGKRHKPQAQGPTPELTFKAPAAASTIKTINQVEVDVILETLQQTGWNKLEAAKRLGIGRQTLYNKIKAYGITEPGQPKAKVNGNPKTVCPSLYPG